MASYLQRYLQGEHVAVWDELVALGAQVYEESVYTDAWAVAIETMRRVRYNLNLVVPRLRALGYVFNHDALPEIDTVKDANMSMDLEWMLSNPPLFSPPLSTIREQLDTFEQEVGRIPLSLRAFYEEIGGISFIGRYSGEHFGSGEDTSSDLNVEDACEFLDPVFVYSFEPDLVYDEPILDASKMKQMMKIMVLAPDVYHKANTSGGGEMYINVPHIGVDAELHSEPHHTTFVDYLRICCFYAGLPGLESQTCPLASKLDELRIGMLPV